MPIVHGHLALGNLAAQCTVCAEQELLPRLPLRVERPAHLDTAERSVVQKAAVVAGERNPLGNTLVDDVGAHLRESIYVGLPAPVVTTLDGIVEEAVDGVPIILVILRRIDAPLGSNGVGAPRAVLKAERLHVVSHLGQRRRSRTACQPRSHHDHIDEALVGRIDQTDTVLVVGPLVGQRSFGNPGV